MMSRDTWRSNSWPRYAYSIISGKQLEIGLCYLAY